MKSAAKAPADATGSAPTRSRRRGKALEDAILEAAWQEVQAVGYARLTMDGVAARAGAARSVIYRRWPNRATLVRAAMRHQLGSLTDQVPDTGELREDLLCVLQGLRDYCERVGPDIIHGLLTELSDIPQDVFAVAPGVVATILQRAAERGDLDPGRITPRITTLPGNLVRHEMLVPHGDLSDASLAGMVDEILIPLVRPDITRDS